jgi:hypothetical protein
MQIIEAVPYAAVGMRLLFDVKGGCQLVSVEACQDEREFWLAWRRLSNNAGEWRWETGEKFDPE